MGTRDTRSEVEAKSTEAQSCLGCTGEVDASMWPCVCEPSMCSGCTKIWFTDLIDSSYNGACKKMRCPVCPRLVPMGKWSSIVEPEKEALFETRARSIITLQCGGCHQRKCLMVSPVAENDREAQLQALVPLFGSIEAVSSLLSTSVPLYMCEEDGSSSVEDMYHRLVALAPSLTDTQQGHDHFKAILQFIPDHERRAILHLRYLRYNPRIHTSCCKVEHCFRCRTRGYHQGLTCDQFQASRAADDIITCPGCSISLVKGDGCSSVTCVCGVNFSWDSRVTELKRLMLESFKQRFPTPEDAGEYAARVNLSRENYSAEDCKCVDTMRNLEPQLLVVGKARVWEKGNKFFTLPLAVNMSDHPSQGNEVQNDLLRSWVSVNGDACSAFRTLKTQLLSNAFVEIAAALTNTASTLAFMCTQGVTLPPDLAMLASAHASLRSGATESVQTFNSVKRRTLSDMWVRLCDGHGDPDVVAFRAVDQKQLKLEGDMFMLAEAHLSIISGRLREVSNLSDSMYAREWAELHSQGLETVDEDLALEEACKALVLQTLIETYTHVRDHLLQAFLRHNADKVVEALSRPADAEFVARVTQMMEPIWSAEMARNELTWAQARLDYLSQASEDHDNNSMPSPEEARRRIEIMRSFHPIVPEIVLQSHLQALLELPIDASRVVDPQTRAAYRFAKNFAQTHIRIPEPEEVKEDTAVVSEESKDEFVAETKDETVDADRNLPTVDPDSAPSATPVEPSAQPTTFAGNLFMRLARTLSM